MVSVAAPRNSDKSAHTLVKVVFLSGGGVVVGV